MGDSLLKLSFPIPISIPLKSRRFPDIPNASTDVYRSIIFSDSPQSSKTNLSLAFQAAVSLSNEGKRVTFILPNALSEMPQLIHGMPQPSTTNMNRLHYPTNCAALVKFLAEFHLPKTFASHAIILYGLEHFIESQSPLSKGSVCTFANICALLIDTVTYISQKQGTTHLIVCCEATNGGLKQTSRTLFDEIWSFEANHTLLRDSAPVLHISFTERSNQLFLSDVTEM